MSKAKYRLTVYDYSIWVEGAYVEKYNTEKEAKQGLIEYFQEHPATHHTSVVIEKVETLLYKNYESKEDPTPKNITDVNLMMNQK